MNLLSPHELEALGRELEQQCDKTGLRLDSTIRLNLRLGHASVIRVISRQLAAKNAPETKPDGKEGDL